MAIDYIKPDLRFMPGRGGLVGAFDPVQQQQGVPNALRLLAQMQPTPAASFPGQAPQAMPQAAPQQPPQAAQPAARSLGPAMTPNAAPASPQAGGQQYMMSGGLGDFLRSNPTMISNLAAGLMSGSRAGVTNAVASLPNAQQHDRQNAALKQWMGTLPEEQQGLARAFPQVAGQSALQAMFAQPKSTSSMTEYQLAKQQGFGGSFLDFVLAQKKAGASNVSVDLGDQSPYQFSDPEKGWYYGVNPETGEPFARPVPGGTADRELQAGADQQAGADAQTRVQADLVTGLFDKAISTLRTSDQPLTGAASIVSGVPGLPQHDFASDLETLRANIGFDKLQAMRMASPTGGALGAVSKFENELLQSVFGSLRQSQTRAKLIENLNLAREVYSQVIHYGLNPNDPLVRKVNDVMGGDPRASSNDPLGLFD